LEIKEIAVEIMDKLRQAPTKLLAKDRFRPKNEDVL